MTQRVVADEESVGISENQCAVLSNARGPSRMVIGRGGVKNLTCRFAEHHALIRQGEMKDSIESYRRSSEDGSVVPFSPELLKI